MPLSQLMHKYTVRWYKSLHISSLIWLAPWAREPFALVLSLCSYSVGLGKPHRAPWAQGQTQRALAWAGLFCTSRSGSRVFRRAPSGPVGPGAGQVARITCLRYCYTPILVWAVTIEQHVNQTSKTTRVTANDVFPGGFSTCDLRVACLTQDLVLWS